MLKNYCSKKMQIHTTTLLTTILHQYPFSAPAYQITRIAFLGLGLHQDHQRQQTASRQGQQQARLRLVPCSPPLRYHGKAAVDRLNIAFQHRRQVHLNDRRSHVRDGILASGANALYGKSCQKSIDLCKTWEWYVDYLDLVYAMRILLTKIGLAMEKH